jgi:hypothetical protein
MKILLKSTAANFEPLYEGQLIPVPDSYKHCVEESEHGFFMRIQHDHFLDSSTHGKLLVRDLRYRGAMSAKVNNYDKNNPPKFLRVLRLSRSGKSVITEAVTE